MPANPLENFINNERDGFDADLPGGLWNRISEELDTNHETTGNETTGDEKTGNDHDLPMGHAMTDEDSLETFIRINRPAFDEAEAPAYAWKQIRKQLPGRVMRLIPKARLNKYRAIAAAAVLLLVSTLFVGREMGMRAIRQQEMAVIEAVAPGFNDMENYYQSEIDRSFKLVSLVNKDPLLKADLNAIDKAMIELKKDLPNVPKEERAAVIANLIESYQIKLSILQKILDKLPSVDKTDAAKTNKDETISL